MRTAGLLALAIFLPAVALAAELVNINTADAALLDTLPHIGPTLAQRIIDYRTEHGPFARIEDLQNVSGIGSGSNYADIAPLITVGDAAPADPAPATPPATSTPPVVTSTASVAPPPASGPAEYLPIPALRIIGAGDRIVSSGADTAFAVSVYDGNGNRRDDALVTWAFGDGMHRTGANIFHAYREPGEYLAVVRAATADGGDAREEVVVTVKQAGIKIASVSPRGIMLANGDSRPLDLSHWRLVMGGQEFKIPEDTVILAGRTVLFPAQVIELPPAAAASLLYPNGEVAAAYPALPAPIVSAVAQPLTRAPGSVSIQKVEPITSTTDGAAHEEEADAPAAATELAAAGAAVAPEADARSWSLFRSPWTLGLLGVIALAGGAFIFL